jgi:TolB-like protein/Flp pilus assembly protein TadD
VYDAILHSTPAPLAELRRDLPPELVSVIERALAKDPAARYPGVAALRAALAAVPVPAGASGTAEPPSIAVLPFANMSADPENEYFTDGMAEEIINSLCKIEALRVASRTSSFAFKGKLEDIRKIGRTLGVSTVLEGSVRKIGQRLRITAQLVKVDDGYHLWSERFDRNLEDVFAVQDEIAESIAAVLRVLLSAREQQAIRKIPTRSVEAYDFYLRGLAYVRLIREDSLRLGEQMFRRAVELDPEFALAWAGIAESCAWRYTWFEPRPEVRATADEASRKVLALDPQLAEGHVARGQAATLFNDHALAAREFETASRIDPRLWGAYDFHARTCMNVGRLEEAARLFRRAIEVRPDDYQAPSLLNSCLLGLGRLEERKEVAARAIRVIEKHVQLHPDDVRAVYFGAGEWSALGEREKALEWARRALDMVPGDPGVRYNVACILVAEGQHDEALDLLERNVAVGWGNAEWVRNDPDWTPLRDHPRFRDLVARMPARGTV